ncbi:MAG: class I SAM-dependent methyltransferase [Saprospiraceae bacterium]|nr:class I SAM-dependent methyltransferase [Saprospiraceae bacterium]
MVNKEIVSSCLVCQAQDTELFITTKTMMAHQDDSWSFNRCRHCGMVALSPRVVPKDLHHYYTESYLPYRGGDAWGKYKNLVDKDQNKIDVKRLKIVRKYLTNSQDSILDVGCGKPSFLKVVQERLGVKSIGLDFSDEGWKNEPEQYQNLALHVGSIENLPEGIHPNVITMWHYLEHDYAPIDTIQLLNSRVSKGATLVIEVPNLDSYTRKKYGKYWSGYHTPRHTGLYTPATMKLLLENNGWKVEEQYTYGTLDPYTLDWMSRMEVKGIDWTESMESYFTSFVIGKILRPYYFFPRLLNLGFMTTVAIKK